MPAQEIGSNSKGIAFLVSAGIVYVNGTLVGQEQKALESRLSSIPTPNKK